LPFLFTLQSRGDQHMRRQNVKGFRSRYVRLFRAMGLTFTGMLLVVASGYAGVLGASWTAPTTKSDASLLTNLASIAFTTAHPPHCALAAPSFGSQPRP
jgi:hypothetical protein